jgi:endonuclease YncB( thermonuclease family)
MRRIAAAAVLLAAVTGAPSADQPATNEPATTQPASGRGWAPVVQVVGGDTVKVERDDETVALRLIGIDTPERAETEPPTKPRYVRGQEPECRYGGSCPSPRSRRCGVLARS